MKLFTDSVSPEMMVLLQQLMTIDELKPFRLVGGTALALQYGHRASVDIDLFAAGKAETHGLPKVIDRFFGSTFQLVSQNRNGFVGLIDKIKVDIVDWKVPFTGDPMVVDNIRMATAPDIFASKCDAILERKAEKDFVDISIISSNHDFSDLFRVLRTRYSFITTGAITAFLLRRDLIIRDYAIRYFPNYSFESLAEGLHKRIVEYEQGLKKQKESEAQEREKRIQDLVNQKRNKPK